VTQPMRILVADDDPVARTLLASSLGKLGFDVTAASDGGEAWRILENHEGRPAPELVMLDWMMPEINGIEICRRLQNTPGFELVYVILLTSRSGKEDLATGLASGANDYITKPFHPAELEARVRGGERVVRLQQSLSSRIAELEQALEHVRRLQGLLPICSYCKKVRNETNYWQQVDSYLSTHTDVELTHSVCPDCLSRVMRELDEAPA
jgi:sigma-B regulation protein RsbU (phosphoserine phosphatase)